LTGGKDIVKRFSLSDLNSKGDGHILKGLIPGKYLSRGGLSFKKPGERSHDVGCSCSSCDGKGHHIHTDEYEVFILLQGRARMEINGISHAMVTGDVVVVEPGEDHHLVSDENDPCVNITLHTADSHHTAKTTK
jgi:mannose-6-phosphate isomerase-like protein (cupin superfamily)